MGAGRFDERFLRKLEYLYVVSKKIFAGQNRAERRTRQVGSGIEFADHRDYVAGDDLRTIDWSVYGRMERLLVRLFEEDEDLSIYVLIDASASMALGAPSKLDLAMRAGAALAYVGLANLDRVAVYPIGEGLGEGLPPARGKGRILPLLSWMGGVEANGRTSLAKAAAAFVHRHRRRGIVIVISDFYDPAGYAEALDLLRYNRFEPTVIQVTGADDARPPLRGDVTIVDVETGDEREVTVSSAVLDAYARRHSALLRDLARFCRERSIPCFQTTSDVAFDDLVLRAFRGSGLLA